MKYGWPGIYAIKELALFKLITDEYLYTKSQALYLLYLYKLHLVEQFFIPSFIRSFIREAFEVDISQSNNPNYS